MSSGLAGAETTFQTTSKFASWSRHPFPEAAEYLKCCTNAWPLRRANTCKRVEVVMCEQNPLLM